MDYSFYEKITIGSGGDDYTQSSWRTSSASVLMVLDLLYVQRLHGKCSSVSWC